jgi:hypothetical protein
MLTRWPVSTLGSRCVCLQLRANGSKIVYDGTRLCYVQTVSVLFQLTVMTDRTDGTTMLSTRLPI